MCKKFEIDALGQPCPMPLLMLKRELKKVQSSDVIVLKASDPNSQIDIARFCQLKQLKCQMSKIAANEFHYTIESL